MLFGFIFDWGFDPPKHGFLWDHPKNKETKETQFFEKCHDLSFSHFSLFFNDNEKFLSEVVAEELLELGTSDVPQSCRWC